MSRKRVPVLPIEVKNLLTIYGLEWNVTKAYGDWYFDVGRPDDIRARFSLLATDSIDTWMDMVRALERGDV